MTIEEALDFEGLGIYDEKIKTHIQNEIEKETLRATTVEDNKVNNTDVAKSNALGLVKSGTDITVDLEGNVSINDNSHNHLLENISDLLTTKDELNVLNGIDVQTTELNKLKGVTDNVQTQLNKKAPLDSPDLTGIPTAPTAESGNKTTQIATTEFVQNEITGMEEKSAAKTLWGEPVSSYIGNGTSYEYKFAIPFHKETTYKEQFGSYYYERNLVESKNKSFYANDGLWYKTKPGTTSQLGFSELIIGNNKWSNIDNGTYQEGNQYGILSLYGRSYGTGVNNSKMKNYFVQIYTDVLTNNQVITIPNASGTLALTSSNVASADKAIKAEQDIDGNVINTTYAPIKNPTIKDSFTVKDTISGNLDTFNVTIINNRLSYKMGLYCSVNSGGAMAQGNYTRAEGYDSHTEGFKTTASAYASHAEGEYTVANGRASHAEGYQTVTTSEYQLAIGKNNDTTTMTSSTLFVIGNGSAANSRSNAFRFQSDGTAYAKSSFTSTGADYAEFFEWLDRNTDSEDRRGYFVTLDVDKIKIASPGDYILGVISGQPSVIGNGDECWMGKYILDDFGAYVYEDYEYEQSIINEETGEFETVKRQGKRYKENPEYDSSKPYIQRKDRPEWDCVGMMGVLSVRDDGTCQVNGYCKVADGGIATSSDSGYRVIKRVNDNIVKIVFKG